MSVLENLQDATLIEPVKNVFETVVFTSERFQFLFDVVKILRTNRLHIAARITSFKIIEQMAKVSTVPSKYQISSDFQLDLLAVFEDSMKDPSTTLTDSLFTDLKYATLLAYKELIISLNSSEQMKKDSSLIGFVRSITEKLVEHRTMVASNENVSVAGIDLLQIIMQMMKKNKNKKPIREFWEALLIEGGLCTQLQAISDDRMAMETVSKSVKQFLRELDSI